MKHKNFLYSQKVAPYVFVLPFILSFAIFWIYPLITSFTMSFQDIGAIKSEWIGFNNYAKLLKDNVFHIALANSAKYMFFTLVLLIPFPMLFAVLLDSNLVKAKGVWKAILYMPALTSVVISGTLFRLMFTEYQTGQMNLISQALGFGTYKWLKNGWSGMLALLVVACWRWTGVNMLYFLSGLKAIDSSLYEAADIDGADAWQKFSYVTLPLMKPSLAAVGFMMATAYWNDWQNALLYIDSDSKKPLQLLLVNIQKSIEVLLNSRNIPSVVLAAIGGTIPQYSATMATVLVVVGPIVIVYPFFQKYFVKGLTVGSVKG